MGISRIRISEVVWFLFLGYKLQNCNVLLHFRLNCAAWVTFLFSVWYLVRVPYKNFSLKNTSIVVLSFIVKSMHSEEFYSHDA